MDQSSSQKTRKRELLKALIRELHEGASPEEVKGRFRELVKDITPVEIVELEQDLISAGMPREEIQRLCGVHLSVFTESLEQERLAPSAGHPIAILMGEHEAVLGFATELKELATVVAGKESLDSAGEALAQAERLGEHLKNSTSHYAREENVLFPYLEKHGITQPPAIMWSEHDKIREIEKTLHGDLEASKTVGFPEFSRRLGDAASLLAETLSAHFYKENHVLFPTALKVIEGAEWTDIRGQFDEIGYCSFTHVPTELGPEKVEAHPFQVSGEGALAFETGTLSQKEIEALLNALPVDVTFVDSEDTVRYFSQSKDRIFTRTKAVIGRKVQQCHPQKSVHLVDQILDEFKSGKRDVAEFWIKLGERLVHIRYFPVRDGEGRYLGVMEVTQDITDIKRIEGEKRLV